MDIEPLFTKLAADTDTEREGVCCTADLAPAAPPGDVPAKRADPEIEAVFIERLSTLDTQPLRRLVRRDPGERRAVLCLLVFILSGFGGMIIGTVTSPIVIVTLIPVEQMRSLTTELPVPLRPLAPVTLTRSQSTPTSGIGTQAASTARGTLTFYNGSLSLQEVAQGTSITGRDGVAVVTIQAVVIPAANPPAFGQASVLAQSLHSGASGNIQAGDINQACCGTATLVKNLAAFSGGRDARTYRAVAQRDLDTLTAHLRASLSQQISGAFTLQTGEAAFVTSKNFNTAADHQVGEEATSVTVQATLVGRAVAYPRQALLAQAAYALQGQTSPGRHFHLLEATVQAAILTISPLRATCHGLWVYTLSEADLQADAQAIAGKSAQQAQAILLQQGGLEQVTIAPQSLPRDPAHIQFRMLVSA